MKLIIGVLTIILMFSGFFVLMKKGCYCQGYQLDDDCPKHGMGKKRSKP